MRRGRSKALLALALFTPAVAAQTGAAAGSVRLQRVPPFDHWCVAPVCQSNDERPHPALLRLPSAVLPEASDGLLEQELKARLATAVDGQARALDVWSKPVADLSDSVIAALASQRQKFANSFGLTGAVLRAGLVLETASAIPAHADCAGSQRLDAIYEGLAISVALAPLHFPNASGTLNASCVETARDAELLVDRRALRALVPANVAQAVARAITKIKAADAACRPLLSQGSAEGDANAPSARAIAALPEHASVAELVTYWNGLQQLRTPELPQNAPACAAALGGPEAIPLPELSPLGDLGLMQTEAELLASALTASAALTQARSEVEARVEQLLQSGTVTKEALQALLERILRDLKPHALSADVWSHVMDALRAASVVDAMGQASVDPSVLVQTLKEAYGLDEHGVPTLRTLLGFKPTPWVAEANAGVPSLSSNDFRVIGDARLGYQGKHLGFVAHGGIK